MTYRTADVYAELVTVADLTPGDVIAYTADGTATGTPDEFMCEVDVRRARRDADGTPWRSVWRLENGELRRDSLTVPVWRALRDHDGEIITDRTVRPAPVPSVPADILAMHEKGMRADIRTALLARQTDGDTPRTRLMEEMMRASVARHAEAAGLSTEETLTRYARLSEEIAADIAARTPTHRIDVRYVVPGRDGWQSSGRDMEPLRLKAESDGAAIKEAMGVVWDKRGEWVDAMVTVVRLSPSGDGEVIMQFVSGGLVGRTAGKGVTYV